jgi:DNA-binding XRE family transcriptional regulator
MRWRDLRLTLKQAREKTSLKQATFARHAGINRHTVRRLEDVDGMPTYEPERATITAWLKATGSTDNYSSFVSQFETDKAGEIRDDAALHLTRRGGDGAPTDHPVSRLSDADRRQLESLAFALLRAIDHPFAVLTVSDVEEEEPGGSTKGA